jgi:hypothetical protein
VVNSQGVQAEIDMVPELSHGVVLTLGCCYLVEGMVVDVLEFYPTARLEKSGLGKLSDAYEIGK